MNENATRYTSPEFAEKFAPLPDDYFILNRETGKIELHFDKSTYGALTDAQKGKIKSSFLWGRNSGCWISRCKWPNTGYAARVAEEIGLYNAGETGERLSFAEQQERKAERAERRAERYEARADAAQATGAALQKPIDDMHGDIAFFTQPNINSSAGRAFTRRRERMFAAFERGMEEFRKSDYWRERAAFAQQTAKQEQLKNKAFVSRRIDDAQKEARKVRRSIEEYETMLASGVDKWGAPLTDERRENIPAHMEHLTNVLEAALDKLGFYQDALDALGGVEYDKENIFPGYVVEVERFGAVKVLSAGPKNFVGKHLQTGMPLEHSYAEIVRVVSARKQEQEAHPFKVGDTFTCSHWNAETCRTEKLEYRIIRATDKSVTIQTGDEKPFVRKPSKVQWAKENEWRLCITDWNDGIVYKIAD